MRSSPNASSIVAVFSNVEAAIVDSAGRWQTKLNHCPDPEIRKVVTSGEVPDELSEIRWEGPGHGRKVQVAAVSQQPECLGLAINCM